MRRAAWFAVLGAAWAGGPAPAAVVTLSLSAGRPGAAPADADEVLFETPHGPPVVALTAVPPGGTLEALTGGGQSLFSPLATPLLLDTTGGGSAFVTSGSPPAAPTPGSGGLIAAPPQPGGPVPTGAALLGVVRGAPGDDGGSTLTATLTDSAGNLLRSATVDLPAGGWWVLGLTAADDSAGGGNPDPVDPPDPETPPPPPPPPPPVDSGGAVTTPEPGTLLLAGFGLAAAAAWRRKGRR